MQNQRIPPNAKARPRTRRRKRNPLTLLLVILLIAALVACGIAVHKAHTAPEDLSGQISSQQQVIDDLSQQVSEANSTIAQQQSEIAGLQSDLQQRDQSISSYKEELADITSRYNQAVTQSKNNTGSSGGKVSVSPYATVGVTEKTCYLTFDDGPSGNTLKILDILKQYNVKATFFVIGSNKLSYVKRMQEEGHTVALHTYSHNYSKIYRSQKAYFEDLQQISDAVQQYIGQAPKVMRFPGGSSNTVSKDYCSGIMTALSQEVTKRGYVYFDWNVDSNDASGNNVPVSKILDSIKTYGGKHQQDVVLMHDTDAKDTTVEALPQIIEFYINAGYTFAPLTTSTPPVTHGINN